MKLWCVLVVVIAISTSAMGQSYYCTVNKGVTDEYNMSAPGGIKIAQGPMNDGYSPVQTLPFAWQFYGAQVTQFKASDNGYITFDVNTTVSAPANGALPSAAGPNHAIYAFWDNLELSNNPSFITNDIRTYTVGTAPGRVFVVQWHCTPLGKAANANYLFFAIRLYEQGDFDLLFQQIRLDGGVMSGTAGCENTDGSAGTMVAGSPNFTYTGGVYLKENVPVYTFTYGAQKTHDVVLKSLEIPELIAVGKPCDIAGTVINHGTETVMNIEVNYQVGSGPVQTDLFANMALGVNETAPFVHFVRYTPEAAGRFDTVRVWITRVNGQPDDTPEDNTLSHAAFVNLGISAEKNVLIEEFSTAPCGYCPEGQLYLQRITEDYPHVIGVTHHSGYLTDAMTIPESVAIAERFAQGAPTACIDRILWPGQSKVAISRADWERRTVEAARRQATVQLRLFPSWEPSTRRLNVDCTAEFVDYPFPGDMRLNVYFVEDSVSKTGQGYDQTNYYNTTSGHPLFGKGDPIVGYVHRHVLRAVPTGARGEAGIIPALAMPGGRYTQRYGYTLPTDMHPSNMTVIGFVSSERDGISDILNAASIPADAVTGLSPSSEAPPNAPVIADIFPNPSRTSMNARVFMPRASDVLLEIADLSGRVLHTTILRHSFPGERTLNTGLPELPTGTYQLRVHAGGAMSRRLFTVLR